MNIICLITGQHRWSEPISSSKDCKRHIVCERCGEMEYLHRIHSCKEWKYFAASDGCIETGVCQKCGEYMRIAFPEHEWSEWENGKRTCSRCGTVEEDNMSLDDVNTAVKSCGCPDRDDPCYHYTTCDEVQELL